MLRTLAHHKIDPQKWNNCVIASDHSSIYGLYDSVCTACKNWIGVIYNDYEAVAVLPIKKKIGLVYSWHPQFMGPLGIFTQNQYRGAVKEMLDEVSKHSLWIKMYYWQNEKTMDFKISEKVYQELEMKNNSIDQIRAGYNENTKRNLKKAVKRGLTIRGTTDVDLLIAPFKKNKGNQIENINENSYILLKKLMNHWLNTGAGHISAVYSGEKLQAIGYFLVHHQTLIYYKGVVTEYGKENGAMHFLIDHEIRNHAGQYNYFDFGGSNTASVARFYKGFGGTDQHYYFYEYKKLQQAILPGGSWWPG